MNQRNDWIFEQIKNPLDDKDSLFKNNVINMLNISTKIFKYNNLPDTIKQKDLEIQLQTGGYAIWKEVNGKLYTFKGGLGGEPNPYYLPTKAIIANPALKYNETLNIDTECVVMLNDYFYRGMMPTHNKYGALLTEAELTLKYSLYNARIPALVQAGNDTTYKSAEELFKKIIEGKEYGVVASKQLLDGLSSYEFYKQNHIKEVIESIQYIKGSWYNAIGLNAAFNMKREAINEAESNLNEDILFPSLDVMLDCRKSALEKINSMYNTNITVDYDSIWWNNKRKEYLSIKAEEKEININEIS